MVLIISPLISVSVVHGYVIAVWSSRCSMVMVSPGSSEVPQRKPGEKAISASFSAISASTMSWSHEPLKLPRR